MPVIVLAPDKFKTVISAEAACAAMARGILDARPDAGVVRRPMADGGEGTLDCLLAARKGVRRTVPATGPLGLPIDVTVGLIDEARTAVVEMALVAGYALVPASRRNPLIATTYGLGQVLKTVIETGVQDVLLGIGGSATLDGGAGMMQALGMVLLDANGRRMAEPAGGACLPNIRRVVWESPPDGLPDVVIHIAADVLNPACGLNGAAHVYGPQKGATAEMVDLLDRGLANWADVLEHACGRSIRNEPGTGAAGGVALPLLALTTATIEPGVDVVMQANGLAAVMPDADLVLTGEGCLDGQSMMGKVVGAVARLARSVDVPCIALVGKIGAGADAATALLDRVVTLNAPLNQTEARLSAAAAAIVIETC